MLQHSASRCLLVRSPTRHLFKGYGPVQYDITEGRFSDGTHQPRGISLLDDRQGCLKAFILIFRVSHTYATFTLLTHLGAGQEES